MTPAFPLLLFGKKVRGQHHMAVDSQDLYLRVQYWWVNHKLELRRWWVFSLLIFDALLLLLAAVFLFVTTTGSSKLSQQVTDGAAALVQPVHITARPSAIIVEAQWGVRNENGSTDFLARIANPNTEWYAPEITLSFAVNGSPIEETMTTYLMPGETRHVFFNRMGVLAPGSRVTAKVEETAWERPPSLFASDNTSFSVSDTVFTPLSIISGEQKDATRVTAVVTNESIYGFWAVPVTVIIFRSDEPVAVDEQTIRQIAPFGTATVTSQWLQRIPQGGDIVVEPHVNAFDEENRLPVG